MSRTVCEVYLFARPPIDQQANFIMLGFSKHMQAKMKFLSFALDDLHYQRAQEFYYWCFASFHVD